MKRLLLPLLTALVLPNAVNAGVDTEVHNLCKDVSDYMGCVKANSKNNFWNSFKGKAKKDPKTDNEFSKFIKSRCTFPHMGEDHPQTKACVSYLKQIGEKSKDISTFQHGACIGKYYKFKSVNDYKNCIDDLDERYTASGKLKYKGIGSYEKFGNYLDKKETFKHKGKIYTASRVCPEGENMYWQTNWRKAWEIGCMTIKEKEKYARDLGQRKRERDSQQLKEALDDFGKAINPPTVYCDSFDNGYGFSTTCKQY